MELFGFGNHIIIANNDTGYAKVTINDRSLFVNCLVFQTESPNYTDLVSVQTSCQTLISSVKRPVTYDEILDQLTHDFGTSKVFNESWVL